MDRVQRLHVAALKMPGCVEERLVSQALNVLRRKLLT